MGVLIDDDLYGYLRALRYFASFALDVSLFLEQIPCAKLAKYRKARGVGWFLRDGRPYRSHTHVKSTDY